MSFILFSWNVPYLYHPLLVAPHDRDLLIRVAPRTPLPRFEFSSFRIMIIIVQGSAILLCPVASVRDYFFFSRREISLALKMSIVPSAPPVQWSVTRSPRECARVARERSGGENKRARVQTCRCYSLNVLRCLSRHVRLASPTTQLSQSRGYEVPAMKGQNSSSIEFGVECKFIPKQAPPSRLVFCPLLSIFPARSSSALNAYRTLCVVPSPPTL